MEPEIGVWHTQAGAGVGTENGTALGALTRAAPPCSPSKWPDESGLAKLWNDNRDALLAFPLAAAYGGMWGSVQVAGKLRGSKGVEMVPLGGANITGAHLGWRARAGRTSASMHGRVPRLAG